jgi:hypothetical protein
MGKRSLNVLQMFLKTGVCLIGRRLPGNIDREFVLEKRLLLSKSFPD